MPASLILDEQLSAARAHYAEMREIEKQVDFSKARQYTTEEAADDSAVLVLLNIGANPLSLTRRCSRQINWKRARHLRRKDCSRRDPSHGQPHRHPSLALLPATTMLDKS